MLTTYHKHNFPAHGGCRCTRGACSWHACLHSACIGYNFNTRLPAESSCECEESSQANISGMQLHGEAELVCRTTGIEGTSYAFRALSLVSLSPSFFS